jgi:hypothetical protein
MDGPLRKKFFFYCLEDEVRHYTKIKSMFLVLITLENLGEGDHLEFGREISKV